jgi:hypothetical protein
MLRTRSRIPQLLSLILAILVTTLLGLAALATGQISEGAYVILGKWIGYRWLVTLVVLSGLMSLCLLIAYLILYFQKREIESTPTNALPQNLIRIEQTPIHQKVEPEEPVQWEKFHTFGGITFEFHSNNGKILQYPCCPKHHTLMARLRHDYPGSRLIHYKCDICTEHVDIDEGKLKKTVESFDRVLAAFVKGHLPELPTKSETEVTTGKTALAMVVKTKEDQTKQDRIKTLKYLSSSEKLILRHFIDDDRKWIEVPILNSADIDLVSLVNKGIITKSGRITESLKSVFFIVDWAWEFLKDDPKLLQ